MKILYITTVGGTMNFFRKFIEELVRAGHVVDIACNDFVSKVPNIYQEWGCKIYSIETSRLPLDKRNLIAIRQIKKIIGDEKYDIIHCHTPVAAMCTRVACRKVRKQGTKVFYTAHGFHFYKGAPIKNWLMYYPVEKICSYWTDVLITINKEDYSLARKKMKAKEIKYVPGIGIDLEKFSKIESDRNAKRQELDLPEDATVLLSVGEINKNKNHETVIRAMIDLKDIYYVIAGKGPLEEHLISLIEECKVAERVKLLGFRKDIKMLCEAADAFIFPSFREGLSVAVMEAMASGLPVIASRIRGNTDLIDEKGGLLFSPDSVDECKAAIQKIIVSDMEKMGEYNSEKVRKFSAKEVNKQMIEIMLESQ